MYLTYSLLYYYIVKLTICKYSKLHYIVVYSKVNYVHNTFNYIAYSHAVSTVSVSVSSVYKLCQYETTLVLYVHC